MAEVAEKERMILVAVDAGEESIYALSWTLKNMVMDNSNDTLILLYAKPPPDVYTSMDGTGYLFSSDVMATMEKYGDQMAHSVMDKAKKLCKEANNVKVKVMVENGDPRDIICHTAEKLKVDLLVLGSHGYGIIKRAFLGSVSNYCANNVKCPVMIVKRPKPTTEHK